MRGVLVAALAAMSVAGCGDGKARLERGESRTETSRLWKQEKAVAADGRLSCVVSGQEAGTFLATARKGVLSYRFDVKPDPAPYDEVHRREIARCEADKAARAASWRNCRVDPQFRVRFDIRAGNEERYTEAFAGSAPVEMITLAGDVTIIALLPYSGGDDLTFEVRPVMTWIDDRGPREEILAAAVFRRSIGDLAAGAAFATDCDAFMQGK